MNLRTIASSSDGNATYIYNKDTHIIIDCGIAARDVIAKTGRSKFDAIIITHEHSDHIKGAGPLARKTKTPVYIPIKSLANGKEAKLKNCTIHDIEPTAGFNVKIGSMTITPFSTKHDAQYAIGLIIEDADAKFCYLTDTGSISKSMRMNLMGCDSYFIECDYDEILMEAYTEYDELLKDRIRSPFGHLSNQQAIELIKTFDMNTIRNIILGHLSKNTNSPETVQTLIKEAFPTTQQKFYIAPLTKDITL